MDRLTFKQQQTERSTEGGQPSSAQRGLSQQQGAAGGSGTTGPRASGGGFGGSGHGLGDAGLAGAGGQGGGATGGSGHGLGGAGLAGAGGQGGGATGGSGPGFLGAGLAGAGGPGGPCPALWEMPGPFQHLSQFMVSREGNIPRFYRDQRGLVTIGIGHLVDDGSGGASPASRVRAGRAFALQYFSLFQSRSGAAVTSGQVFADWRSVLNSTRTRGLLSLRPGAGVQLFQIKLRRLIENMYRVQPFSRCLPSGIQMAIVDTRFNSAGVNPYQHSSAVPMWHALDRRRRISVRGVTQDQYDPARALDLFERIWFRPSNAVYQNRHRWRIRQFEAGVLELLAEDERQWNSLIDQLNSP